VTERRADKLAQWRPFLPGALQVFEKRNIDLIEDLVAGPVQFDDKIGDELAPLARAPMPVARYSPAAASTFLPPACSITIGSAVNISAMVIGKSKNSSRVSAG
jgi:hypothetical protein